MHHREALAGLAQIGELSRGLEDHVGGGVGARAGEGTALAEDGDPPAGGDLDVADGRCALAERVARQAPALTEIEVDLQHRAIDAACEHGAVGQQGTAEAPGQPQHQLVAAVGERPPDGPSLRGVGELEGGAHPGAGLDQPAVVEGGAGGGGLGLGGAQGGGPGSLVGPVALLGEQQGTDQRRCGDRERGTHHPAAQPPGAQGGLLGVGAGGLHEAARRGGGRGTGPLDGLFGLGECGAPPEQLHRTLAALPLLGGLLDLAQHAPVGVPGVEQALQGGPGTDQRLVGQLHEGRLVLALHDEQASLHEALEHRRCIEAVEQGVTVPRSSGAVGVDQPQEQGLGLGPRRLVEAGEDLLGVAGEHATLASAGETLVMVGEDQVWRLRGKELVTFTIGAHPRAEVAALQDSELLLAGDGQGVQRYRLDDLTPLEPLADADMGDMSGGRVLAGLLQDGEFGDALMLNVPYLEDHENLLDGEQFMSTVDTIHDFDNASDQVVHAAQAHQCKIDQEEGEVPPEVDCNDPEKPNLEAMMGEHDKVQSTTWARQPGEGVGPFDGQAFVKQDHNMHVNDPTVFDREVGAAVKGAQHTP